MYTSNRPTIDARPASSCSAAQHSLLNVSYSLTDKFRVSAVCGENRRHTSAVQRTQCCVDTGKHRNPAVAYWLKRGHSTNVSSKTFPRNVGSAGGRSAGSGLGRPMSAQQCTLSEVKGSLQQSADEEHIVRLSPDWGCHTRKADERAHHDMSTLSSPPLRESFDHRTHQKRFDAHQHLVFHLPVEGRVKAMEESELKREESAHGREGVELSKSSSTPGHNSTRRHRAAIQTAGDLWSELAAASPSSSSLRQSLPHEDAQLLQSYGFQRSLVM